MVGLNHQPEKDLGLFFGEKKVPFFRCPPNPVAEMPWAAGDGGVTLAKGVPESWDTVAWWF